MAAGFLRQEAWLDISVLLTPDLTLSKVVTSTGTILRIISNFTGEHFALMSDTAGGCISFRKMSRKFWGQCAQAAYARYRISREHITAAFALFVRCRTLP